MTYDLVRYQIRQQLEPLRFFAWEHLPPDLQAVSRPCGDLAELMDAVLPVCAETTAGMRLLLQAKDCFCRAALIKRDLDAQAAAERPQPPEPDER